MTNTSNQFKVPWKCWGIRLFLGALFVVLLSSLPANAQNAQLTGTVKDAQGLAVSNASITVRDVNTNLRRTTVSTEAGAYSVPELTPGSYAIQVVKDGFKTLERKGITLSVATVTRVDLTIQVGGQTETVEVTADASVLSVSTAESSTTISKQQYDNLPLVQQGRIRSPASFVYLTPGVQGNYKPNGMENTAATNQFIVNGSTMMMSELYLSGLLAGQMRAAGNFNESAPPVDAVQEFKIISTLLPADYGHSGASAGIFAVRSGTNAFHGSVYEYFRNNALDAMPWGTTIAATTHQNEFGATIGGPVYLGKLYNGKDRSFFFFSYGGSRRSGVDTLQSMQIPTQDELNGNFSALSKKIYDPATTRLDSTGTKYIRTEFAGNIIPTSRINSIAKTVAGYYPKTSSNYYTQLKGEKKLNPDVYTVRLDHQLTKMQQVFFTYINTNIPRLRTDTALPDPISTVLNQNLSTTTMNGNHNWMFGANKINSLAVGYYRYENLQIPATGDSWKIPQQIGSALPQITFSNGYTGIQTNGGANSLEKHYHARDTFYWTVRSHSLRFGGEWRDAHYDDTSALSGSSTAAFSYKETADPGNVSATGDGFASFLLGQVDSGSLMAQSIRKTRYKYFGFFGQDDWKLSTRMTLNLGLRWEFQTVPVEANDKTSAISLTAKNTSVGNIPGAVIYAGDNGRTFSPTKYDAVSPRIGLTYQINPKFVFRSGYGVYYSNNDLSLTSTGFLSSASYDSSNNGITPAFLLSDGFPSAQTLTPAHTPGLLNGQGGTYWEKNAGVLPREIEWSVGLQYSPSSKWLLEADYVGSKNTRQINPYFENVNQVDSKYLSLGSLLTVSATSTAATAAGIPLPYSGFTGTVAQALRAYPQYLTLTSSSAKCGYSNYHALQLIVDKRMSHGLTVGANFSYSKNLGISSPGYLGSPTNNVLQNASNQKAEYSILPLDVPLAFVLHYTYNLPFGAGEKFTVRRAWMDKLVGGWKISGIHRYQSGYPIPILTSNSLPIFNRQLRPNVVAGVSRGTGISSSKATMTTRIINPAAFSAPAAYSFGNARPTYSDVRSYAVLNEDLSFVKDTKISSTLQWSFYTSFLNAFNRHRVGGINSTFSNANFGQATTVSAPRYIQFGSRIQF